MLYDAIEKYAQKTAMHQSGRPFIDQGKVNPAAGLFGIEIVEPVLRKARIVGTDVGGVIEINPPRIVVYHTDARRVVRRSDSRQLTLPFGELRQHGVDRGVIVLEAEQQ